MQQMIFIADFIACSICFGHHYAHHQGLVTITYTRESFMSQCLGVQFL